MATDPKTGPYSLEEFLVFWQSVVDPSYSRPLIENEQGLEVYTQQMAQLARVSQAIDRTSQGMFIMPWSGQSDLPAAGEAKATVTLTFTRTRRFDLAITFEAGRIFVEESQIDSNIDSGIAVLTGRRYRLLGTLTFGPGEPGPKTVVAEAEKVGYGYNNPEPATLTELLQAGTELQNERASLIPGVPTHRLEVDSLPDVVVPENIGQYIEFTTGANTGQARRMVGYSPADSSVPHGGVAVIERTNVLGVLGVLGTFIFGEDVTQAVTGATGKFFHITDDTLYIVLESTDANLFQAGFAITGAASGATATVDAIIQSSELVAESKTAGWRVLDWNIDLGFTVTNVQSPSGGRTALLDEIGNGRNIKRSPGESDDDYRERIHKLPDTISPNAIRRATNRILAPYGASVTLHETGLESWPGWYYDGDPNSIDPTFAFAFDLDFVVRPQDRFKLVVNYEEMRAFFLVGVPAIGLGDFGMAYDIGASNAYDASPFHAFYDGLPVTAAIIYRNIWQAIDKVRAGGVGFEMIIE